LYRNVVAKRMYWKILEGQYRSIFLSSSTVRVISIMERAAERDSMIQGPSTMLRRLGEW